MSQNRHRPPPYLVTLLAAIVTLAACKKGLCPEAQQVDHTYRGACIAEITPTGRAGLNISPQPRCAWEQLVDLDIFEDFRPGMKIQEARRRIGPPDMELNNSDSNRFWRYERPKGIVQIGHEHQGATVVPFYYWWTLSAFPKDSSLHAFFSPEVLDRLASNRKIKEISILNQCGLPMVVVLIDEGRIHQIYWTNNPGSYAGAER